MERYQPEHLKKWTTPEYYIGADFWDHYVFIGQHRDSDSVDRSNFTCILKELGGESETVLVVRAGHWAVGWVETIMIHEDDAESLRKADEIVEALSDYPLFDDEHHSELEWNEAADWWESMTVRERAELIREHTDGSIFAARRDELPQDDSGSLFEYLRG